MPFLNVRHDGLELLFDRSKDLVLQVFSNHGPMGGDDHRFKAVNLLKLKGLGIGRSRHATKLAVHTKVVLESNGGKRLILGLNGHALFGLHGLMQAIRPSTACHESAREFINNDNLPVLHHILLIAKVQGVGPKGCHEVMKKTYIGGIVKA